MVSIIDTGPNKIIKPLRKLINEVADVAEDSGFPLHTVYGATTWPDHDTLRCADFMINHLPREKEVAAGDFIANYLLRNRDRLGVYFMIWNRRVIRSYSKGKIPAWTWATYTGTSNPHIDHVHLQVIKGYKYAAPPALDETTGAVAGLYVVDASALNGRDAPSDSAKIIKVRPRGFTVRIVSTKQTGGRTWAKGSGGLWYAFEYLKRK